MGIDRATRPVSPGILPGLSRREQDAVDAFVAHLSGRYGEALCHVALFGSRARGDAREESDFDFLIVLDVEPGDFWRQWRSITDLAWDVELAYGIVISIILKSPRAYEEMRRRQPLLEREIQRHGVTLWTSSLGATTSASA